MSKPKTSEAEYIRLTDLTRVRIATSILREIVSPRVKVAEFRAVEEMLARWRLRLEQDLSESTIDQYIKRMRVARKDLEG